MKILTRFFAVLVLALGSARAAELHFYTGTYTAKDGGRGIYAYRIDSETGHVQGGELAAELRNPSFLAIHPTGKFLYAVSEVEDFEGKNTGAIAAFAVSGPGQVQPLNTQASLGAAPCHVSLNAAGTHVFLANYGGGSVAAFPVKTDGSLGAASGFLQHAGSGPNVKRQEGPHAHGIYAHKNGRVVYACDLGTDEVLAYPWKSGALVVDQSLGAKLPPGSGPRHLAVHPTGTWIYVLNELLNTVSVLRRDELSGALSLVQTIPTLPPGFEGVNHTAEIFVHPNGKFVYASNRGHNSLAVFGVGSDGQLTPVEHVSTRGAVPRGFALSPGGDWLIAANQASHTLVVFKVDAASGKLTPTGQELPVRTPVCVVFEPVR
jgi:6-phosphogluconolactonase